MSALTETIVAEVVKQVVREGLRRDCTHDQVAGLSAQAVKAALGALEGEQEDAKDADEASMQAAFWRARAIALGASEDDYRQFDGAVET